jgi:hypothetical protein
MKKEKRIGDNMKKIRAILLIMVCLIQCGCGNIEENNKINEIVIRQFEIDSNTVSIHSGSRADNNDSGDNDWDDNDGDDDTDTEDNNETDNKDKIDNTSIITFEGESSELLGEISGDDVIYNGIKYMNLYFNLSLVELPCDMTSMINFILMNFKADNYIIANLVKNTGNEDEVQICELVTDSIKYDEAVKKYGCDVEWLLSLINSKGECIQIFGCNKYLMIELDGIDREEHYN